jgi:aspartate aminotransferase
MGLSTRIKTINVSPTMKIAQMAIEMKANGENILDLSVGEPDFPTPQNIKNAAIKAINENFTKYTINSGTMELRLAIAKKLKNENGLEFSPNEIIVSNGAKQSIYNAIQVIVNDGDEVIIPSPYYASYPEMVVLAGGNLKFIETSENTNFKISPDQLRNSITERTKLLILCSPCNPTGTTYSEEELKDLSNVIEREKFFVLSDEIYEKIIFDDLKAISIATVNQKLKERTIIINGVSKAYSMTGWRIGYAAANEEIISAMNKIQSHSTSSASSVSQAAALEALTGSQESIESSRKEFESRRNLFYEKISSIQGIKCFKPYGAFYLFPKIYSFFGKKFESFEIQNSTILAEFILKEAKVVVVPGRAFGAEGYIRISFATSKENLELASGRISDALKKLT